MIHGPIIASITMVGFVYFIVLLVIAMAFLKLNDLIFHRTSRKSKNSEGAKLHEERLKNPDFNGLEQHFGHSFPPEIKTLYANHQEILREEFDIANKSEPARPWQVAFYEPADLKHVLEAWPDAKEVFEFANDGCGNGYTIDPRLDNPPVRFYDHETGEWETVAKSIAEFMAMPRSDRG